MCGVRMLHFLKDWVMEIYSNPPIYTMPFKKILTKFSFPPNFKFHLFLLTSPKATCTIHVCGQTVKLVNNKKRGKKYVEILKTLFQWTLSFKYDFRFSLYTKNKEKCHWNGFLCKKSLILCTCIGKQIVHCIVVAMAAAKTYFDIHNTIESWIWICIFY